MPKNEKTDIALIFPYRGWDKFTNEQNGAYHPLGLHSISSYVKQFDYSTLVVTKESDELIGFIETIIEKVSIFGFSCLEDNLVVAANTIKYIKKKYKDKIVFVGGPQAMHLNSDFLVATGCDVIIRGEGELVVKSLLDYYIRGIGSLENIKGIAIIYKGKTIDTGISDLICNLDELPFPDVDYRQDESTASIITGRGCPNHCAFCFDGGNSRKVRYRSINNVIEELNLILEHNPQIKAIQFVDDTFMMNTKRAEQICDYFEELRKHRTIRWICEANVINIYRNPDMVKRMVNAGLVAMQIGIESGNDSVLKIYRKPSNTEMILSVFKICKEANLKSLEGQIIVGGALESDETIQKDCELVRDIIKIGKGMTDISTVYLWPFPSTPISNNPKEFGIDIDQERVEHSIASLRNPVTKTENLSTNQIIYAKTKIDNIIFNTYMSCCLEMSHDEIFKLWNPIAKTFTGKWGFYLNRYTHMVTAMSCGGKKLEEYMRDYDLDEIYSVRTFALLQYQDKYIKFYGLKFSDIEQKILECSTGKMSIKTMINNLNFCGEDFVHICDELYDRCLVTFSLC